MKVLVRLAAARGIARSVENAGKAKVEPPEGVTRESDRTKILLRDMLAPPLEHGSLPRFSETLFLVL